MSKKALYAPLLFLLVSLCACSHLGKPMQLNEADPASSLPAKQKKTVKKKRPAPDVKVLAERREEKRLEALHLEIERLLQKNDHLTALATLRRELQRGTPATRLGDTYLQVLNGSLVAGEAHMAGHNAFHAGLLFRIALDVYPEDEELTAGVILSPAKVEDRIELCANQLMEKGLVFYRAGELAQAMEVWQKTLAFYPQHRPSQAAIQTAYVQLNNLNKITADD
jgi:tetratricopeptide (TPR) repeat protein